MAMAETRRKFDEDFKRGAVQLVFETPGFRSW
jgi:transposase-like protein